MPELLNTISPLDLGWLFVESGSTPMHVGCVQIFAPPANAPPDFAGRLYAQLCAQNDCTPPFSLRMRRQGIGLPHWESIDDIDIETHVQRWALAPPGGKTQLHALVGRLHSEPLDTDLPLWEFHLIEGLEDGSYAVFIKIHHSLMDGIAGMRLLQSMLTTDPTQTLAAPWSARSPVSRLHVVDAPEHHRRRESLLKRFRKVVGEARNLSGASQAMGSLAWAALNRKHSDLQAPYTAPDCALNTRVSRDRGLATADLSLTALRGVADHAGASINDVLLAACAGALREHLAEHGMLPDDSLVAGLPMSVRPPGDTHVGTAVSFIMASLGTDRADARDRLAHIHASTSAAKKHIRGLSRTALTEYTLLMMTPYIAELMTGMAGLVTPAFNIIISNVPGPQQPLYFNGAKLLAMYPLSIVTHGQALNITALGYGQQLLLGLSCCPRRLPDVGALAARIEQELDALVRWAGVTSTRA